jgi:hypothetical protein
MAHSGHGWAGSFPATSRVLNNGGYSLTRESALFISVSFYLQKRTVSPNFLLSNRSSSSQHSSPRLKIGTFAPICWFLLATFFSAHSTMLLHKICRFFPLARWRIPACSLVGILHESAGDVTAGWPIQKRGGWLPWPRTLRVILVRYLSSLVRWRLVHVVARTNRRGQLSKGWEATKNLYEYFVKLRGQRE